MVYALKKNRDNPIFDMDSKDLRSVRMMDNAMSDYTARHVRLSGVSSAGCCSTLSLTTACWSNSFVADFQCQSATAYYNTWSTRILSFLLGTGTYQAPNQNLSGINPRNATQQIYTVHITTLTTRTLSPHPLSRHTKNT